MTVEEIAEGFAILRMGRDVKGGGVFELRVGYEMVREAIGYQAVDNWMRGWWGCQRLADELRMVIETTGGWELLQMFCLFANTKAGILGVGDICVSNVGKIVYIVLQFMGSA